MSIDSRRAGFRCFQVPKKSKVARRGSRHTSQVYDVSSGVNYCSLISRENVARVPHYSCRSKRCFATASMPLATDCVTGFWLRMLLHVVNHCDAERRGCEEGCHE